LRCGIDEAILNFRGVPFLKHCRCSKENGYAEYGEKVAKRDIVVSKSQLLPELRKTNVRYNGADYDRKSLRLVKKIMAEK
jgi:hypothetical protein